VDDSLPIRRLTEAGMTQAELAKLEDTWRKYPNNRRQVNKFFSKLALEDIIEWLEVQRVVGHFSTIYDPVTDPMQVELDEGAALASFIPLTQKGAAGGVGSLDEKGDLELSQVPPSVERSNSKRLAFAPVNALYYGLKGDGSDEGAAIVAMMSNSEVKERGIYFPYTSTGYGTTKPIPFTTDMHFDRNVEIKALEGMPEGPIINCSRSFGEGVVATERLYMTGQPILNANYLAGVYCFGAVPSGGHNGDGNPIYTIESMVCLKTPPAVYAIGGDSGSGTSNPGLLTGSRWGRVRFGTGSTSDACAQWLNIGNNQADCLFMDVRGVMSATPGKQATGPVIRCTGYNVRLISGYAYLTNSEMNASGLSAFLESGSDNVRMENWFIESDECNLTHFSLAQNPTAALTLEEFSWTLRGPLPKFRAVARIDNAIGANVTQKRVRLRNFDKQDSASQKLTADVLVGATTLPAALPARLAAGMTMILDQGQPNEETVTITTVSGETVTVPALAFSHASETIIKTNIPLFEIKNHAGAGPQSSPLTLEFGGVGSHRIGAYNASGHEGFSEDSAIELAPCAYLDGEWRGKEMRGLASPNGSLLNLTSADTTGTGLREQISKAWRRSSAIVENFDRYDATANTTPTSGTLFLSPGGILRPDLAAISAIEHCTGSGTAGAGLTKTGFCIVQQSSGVILAISEESAAATWPINTARKLNLQAIQKGTGKTTNGSKTISEVTEKAFWRRGDAISGAGIEPGTTVIDTNYEEGTIKLSIAATATASGVSLSIPKLRVLSPLLVQIGVLIIGTTIPTLAGKTGLSGLLNLAPAIAGNTTSTGLSAMPTVGTAVVLSPVSGGFNPAWGVLA
jgi:hypothetical protein